MELEYEYFENRKPFYTVMNRMCNYTYGNKAREMNSGWLGTVVKLKSNTCHVSYDMKMLVNNWSDIKIALKKTKAYKTCDEIKSMVDDLKDDVTKYKDVREFNNDMQCIFSLARYSPDGSFEWDVKDRNYLWE